MIETVTEPSVRITCDRCGESEIVHGSDWHTNSIYLAGRMSPDAKLQAMPDGNCLKTLCDTCAAEYEEWWIK